MYNNGIIRWWKQSKLCSSYFYSFKDPNNLIKTKSAIKFVKFSVHTSLHRLFNDGVAQICVHVESPLPWRNKLVIQMKIFSLSEKFLFWNVARLIQMSTFAGKIRCLCFVFVCEVKIIDSKVLRMNIDTHFRVSFLRKIFNILTQINANKLKWARGAFTLRLF